MDWQANLSERELKEIEFARLYESQFSHGTDGHNRLLLIEKLAAMLDYREETIKELHEHIARARRQGFIPLVKKQE